MIISLFDSDYLVPYRQHYRLSELWRMYTDSTRSRDILGLVPEISLEQELKRTVEWFVKSAILRGKQ